MSIIKKLLNKITKKSKTEEVLTRNEITLKYNDLLKTRSELNELESQLAPVFLKLENMITSSPVLFALEMSLLRKVNFKSYDDIRGYVMLPSPVNKKNKLTKMEAEIIRLAMNTPRDLAKNNYAILLEILDCFEFWVISKLFRFPLFHNNARLFNQFLDEIIKDNFSFRQLSSKQTLHLLTMSYAISKPSVFLALISKIKSQVNTNDVLMLSFINNFDLPITKNKNITSRKLKVALCISGQMRGYEKAFESWSLLKLQEHDIDIYIHTWDNLGRRYPDPEVVGSVERSFSNELVVKLVKKAMRLYSLDEFKSAYPSLDSELNSSSLVCVSDLKRVYGEESKIVIEHESDFSNLTNQDKMHYKIASVLSMIDSPNDYDLIVRIRPDKSFTIADDKFDLNEIYNASLNGRVIFAEENLGLRESLVMGDQLNIGIPELVIPPSLIWGNEEKYYKYPNFPKSYQGHSSLAFSFFYNGVRSEKVKKIKPSSLLDAKKIDIDKFIDLIRMDIETRKYPLKIDDIFKTIL